MLARTNRLSPAMLTTTSVITGRMRCLPMSPRAENGLLPKYAQYLSDPNGGEARVSVMPLAGSQWRVPAKMKISMIPSQNVGIANPTYENTVAALSNSEYRWIAAYTPRTIAIESHTTSATPAR